MATSPGRVVGPCNDNKLKTEQCQYAKKITEPVTGDKVESCLHDSRLLPAEVLDALLKPMLLKVLVRQGQERSVVILQADLAKISAHVSTLLKSESL